MTKRILVEEAQLGAGPEKVGAKAIYAALARCTAVIPRVKPDRLITEKGRISND